MTESEEIESDAIGLWRQYKFFLPAVVKKFLHRVAVFNKWEKLKQELER